MRLQQQLHELRQDTAISVRHLRRSPGFAVIATITLALGIGATTAVFAVVDAVMLRPLPFRDVTELFLVRRDRPGGGGLVESTYPEYRELRDGAGAFAGLAAVPSAMQPAVWTDGTSSEPLAAVGALGNLFDVLGARALLGRTLTPEDDRRGAAPNIVLSHGLWTRTFGGDRDIVGRRLELNGTRYTVVGVMPKGFEYPRGSEAWIALVPAIDSLVDNRQIGFLNIVGRIRPGVAVDAAREEAARLFVRAATVAGFPTIGLPVPRLISLHSELLGDARRGMVVLLAAAAPGAARGLCERREPAARARDDSRG